MASTSRKAGGGMGVRNRWLLGLGATTVVGALGASGVGLATPPSGGQLEATACRGTRAYRVDIDPRNFVARVDNPYFPLVPGTVFRLRGLAEGGIERERITVTDRIKKILGVQTTVVRDVVRVGGGLAELTHDWYAQDRSGNVWYFGERTAEYENGEVVSRNGSWEAGVDGALPGIIMNADPRVTDSCRQEFYRGEAEDLFWVVRRGESRAVPAGTFHDVVRTLEWTRLEPRIVVQKFHAPGVGLIAEQALTGPTESVELLSVTHPKK
jgi:hypothetical protein